MIKAMILAAGEGTRLREMTRSRPKPLISVRGKPMIEHALVGLREAGIISCVINLRYLGQMISDHLGDGRAFGVDIAYSREKEELGTGGGVKNALPLLGDAPFLLVNADILHDVDLRAFVDRNLADLAEGHLLLRGDPEGKDFGLSGKTPVGGTGYTFCGISILRPQIFRAEQRKTFPLVDVFTASMQRAGLTAETHPGFWLDLGTAAAIERAEASAK